MTGRFDLHAATTPVEPPGVAGTAASNGHGGGRMSPAPALSGKGKLAGLIPAVWARVHESNEGTPWLFRSANRLAVLEAGDETGRLQIHPVSVDRLRASLVELVEWTVTAGPPLDLVKSMVACPDPGLPKLRGIVEAPVFLADGTILSTPGYHAPSRLFYQPGAEFILPTVPTTPTEAEVVAARTLILEDLLPDFPFATAAERAHAVALLLLPFVRAMINGPTPLHLIEAPKARTGKGLLAAVLLWPALGRAPTVTTEPHGDDEMRKRLTSVFRAGRAVVFLDNLKRKVQDASLMAAITAPGPWGDRVLGATVDGEWLIRCTWLATGNNPRLTDESAGRVARIRLDAGLEHPGQREGFRQPDLRGWAQAHRGELIAAALTLGTAWLTAGRPIWTATRLGGFEEWAGIMGGILQVAGVAGFLGNVEEVLDSAEDDADNVVPFILAWWTAHGTEPRTTGELVPIALDADLGTLEGKNARGDATKLGVILRKLRDQVLHLGEEHGKVKVTRLGTLRKMRWRLVGVDG